MNRQTFLILIAVVVGFGGYWAYESYQEHQMMKAYEALMDDDEDCDVCAARKAAMKQSIDDRKAKADAEQGGEESPEQTQ